MSLSRVPSSQPSRFQGNPSGFSPPRPALNPMAPSIKSVGGVLSSALLKLGYEGGQSSAEMKKVWFCNSNHPYGSKHST